MEETGIDAKLERGLFNLIYAIFRGKLANYDQWYKCFCTAFKL